VAIPQPNAFLELEITTSAFGLLVMTLLTFHTKIVIARERSGRGNLTSEQSKSRQ
jgi:hypothetical protein